MKTYIKNAIYAYRDRKRQMYNQYQRDLMNSRNYWKAYYSIDKEFKAFRKIDL